MILQSLYQRYMDLAKDPSSGVSPLYFSAGKVSYLLEIEPDGSLLQVTDIRMKQGKKMVPQLLVVPEQSSRSSGIAPYFLSDKAEYLLGHYSVVPDEKIAEKKKTDALRKFEASRQLARDVLQYAKESEKKLAVVRAMLAFYDLWDPERVREHPQLQHIMNDLDKGIDTNMAFRLCTQHARIDEADAVRTAWIVSRQQADAESDYNSQCLLTGESNVPIARTHDKIKGIRNAQSAGASLVSFNFHSAESYGKDSMQSYNSPVGRTAMFGYTTALNHLLSSPRNRMWIGDMTVVFWSGQATDAEQIEASFAAYFDSQPEPVEDTQLTEQVQDILKRARNGARLDSDMVPQGNTPFFIMGLSPNNARVAVRFFWQGNFGELVSRLGRHVADLALAGYEEHHLKTPTIYRILAETMRVGGDGRKVGEGPPSIIGGELLRAVIQGKAYPLSLFTMIINRIRADGTVNHLRVSIVKAYLSRYSRIFRNDHLKEELTVELNSQAQEPAYRLGRLFAVLEKAQQEAASGKLNATIKDRYFGAASSNPGAVFPILLKLSQHHMSKSRYGDFRDREVQEILQEVHSFPAHLDLQRQGVFVLGYYHQKQHFASQIKAAAEAKQEAAAAAEAAQ
ncbi:type I-C CRISPR-associated protein Cas8c/Csd1 [Paenibacillus hodogayensis]|uniref:Type I-C CRISPR-associated protein Cas8c/Csd1 n=1 Tax=Paenibacillus hodogayensis TaxID=279208 RepID=A0ABV5VWT4_9BACL